MFDTTHRAPSALRFSVRLAALALVLSSCAQDDGLGFNHENDTVRDCPEPTRPDGRGDPRNAAGYIRYCWPGEARCYCDRDNDCYAQDGYIACRSVAAADAAVDARADVAPSPTRACPEAVYRDAQGTPRSVSTRQVRECFPGESRCYCDRDNDCYRLDGYVACVPPTRADAAVDAARVDAAADVARVDASVDAARVDAVVDAARVDAAADVARVDAVASDAGPLAPDPVAYTGSLPSTTGETLARLGIAGVSRDVRVYASASRGARPPLVVAFHGTNGDGDVMLTESGARAMADANGVVVMAPTARWFGGEGADFDHPGGNGTYWETRNLNPDTNADLVLTRAMLVEAQRRYNVDPDRVYVIGHSNGGFMAELVSVVLRDRIAAFAENSAGLVTCATRPSCTFQGTAATCADLARQGGWCSCAGAGLPTAIPTTGRRVPGYLSHGTSDPMVSVYYTCMLADRLQRAGAAAQTYLWSGGHYLSSNFARNAWSFLAPYRRQ